MAWSCEPHSTPQQLLITSKDGGLKILDTIFEDDDCSADDNGVPINQLSSRSSIARNIEVVSIDSIVILKMKKQNLLIYSLPQLGEMVGKLKND